MSSYRITPSIVLMSVFAERDAMGNDEYHPLIKRGSNLTDSDGIGYAIIDAIDTMQIMGLQEEYNRAREWISTFDRNGSFNTFEVSTHNLTFCVLIPGVLTRQQFAFWEAFCQHITFLTKILSTSKKLSNWQSVCFLPLIPRQDFHPLWLISNFEKELMTPMSRVLWAQQKSPRFSSNSGIWAFWLMTTVTGMQWKGLAFFSCAGIFGIQLIR